MREFKFRAWAENAEAMVYQEDSFKWIGDGMMEFFVDDEGVKALYQIRENSDEEPTIDNPPIYSTDDMVKIMQYTGLKDKNGREIYVGDITELEVEGDIRRFVVNIKTVIREVVSHPSFDDDTAKVAITGVVFEWDGFELFPCVDENEKSDVEDMVVIGNIHENPELLGDDK